MMGKDHCIVRFHFTQMKGTLPAGDAQIDEMKELSDDLCFFNISIKRGQSRSPSAPGIPPGNTIISKVESATSFNRTSAKIFVCLEHVTIFSSSTEATRFDS